MRQSQKNSLGNDEHRHVLGDGSVADAEVVNVCGQRNGNHPIIPGVIVEPKEENCHTYIHTEKLSLLI